MANPTQSFTTFFMFSGQAEEAMNFYISVFDQSKITSIVHHNDGKVLHATFILKGQQFMCIDNTNGDQHNFTPAMSLFFNCETSEEIDRVYEKLSQAGKVLMPLAQYPFSDKFAWVEDKYGVSWQLNLGRHE